MKLVFHIPSHTIVGDDDDVWVCDSFAFRRELVGAFAEADCMYSIPVNVFMRGREFLSEHLVLYVPDDSCYAYINIFHELVCKYHGSLEQESYYYEHGDVLVCLKIGGDDCECC